MATQSHAAKDPKPHQVNIYIDGVKYKAPIGELAGAQVRALTKPPVGDDRDLWLDIVDELDELIADDAQVTLEHNMRFFTVPRVINPGSV